MERFFTSGDCSLSWRASRDFVRRSSEFSAFADVFFRRTRIPKEHAMTRETLKRTTCLAVAGAFALALAGTAAAAPLSVADHAAISDQALIQPVVYHHHYRHHYRHYGAGAAVAGTALGLIGGA